MLKRVQSNSFYPHLTMKFPSVKGTICTVRADQKTTRQCYAAGLKIPPYIPQKERQQPETIMVDLDPRTNTDDIIQPQGDMKPFVLGKSDNQTTTIGADLGPNDERNLIKLLKDNVQLFVWSAADMPGIHPSVMTHKLSVFKEAKPVAQKK